MDVLDVREPCLLMVLGVIEPCFALVLDVNEPYSYLCFLMS